ncbi:MAG: DUF2059 domain-containing protein [Gammaproteobacteria bacterium]|nr:DUF2059 domain-containing protein [Gammaproteobacteria bacterium]
MRRLSIVLCSTALLLPAANVTAQDEAHRQAALAVLEAQGASRALEQLYEQARRVMRTNMGQLQSSPERKTIAEHYMDKLAGVLRSEIGWNQVRDDYVALYMNHYAKEELAELAAFYRSPIGLKMVERTPQLLQGSVKITEKYLGRVLPLVSELSLRMSEELKAAREKESINEPD